MNTRTHKAAWPAFLIMLAFALAACGGGKPTNLVGYKVSGTVVDGDLNPMPDVIIYFSDTSIAPVTTDDEGRWTAANLQGEVTVTPFLPGHSFKRKDRTVTTGTNNVDFVGILNTKLYRLSGTVVDGDNDAIADVTIRFQFDGFDLDETTTTTTDGTWSHDGLFGAVTVSAEDPAYVFDGARQQTAATAGVDFTGDMNACTTGSRSHESNPCVMTRIKQVQHIAAKLDGYYALGADIDASATETWLSEDEHGNDIAGFAPVGTSENPFLGTLDGRDFEIRNLHIYQAENDDVGLFGVVGDRGNIHNLGLVNGRVEGRQMVGAFAGRNKGTIAHVYNTGAVISVPSGNNPGRVGGIVGYHENGRIEHARNAGDVEGDYAVGGIAGATMDSAHIEHVDNTGEIVGFRNATGGIVGQHFGTLLHADNRGAVTGGTGETGGIAGRNHGTVQDVNNFAEVVGRDFVGGIVGTNAIGTILRAHSDADVSGNDHVGGIAGRNYDPEGHGNNAAIIDLSSNVGNVSGRVGVGGIVGHNNELGTVIHSFNTGDVTASHNSAGGVAGTNENAIGQSYNTGDVRGPQYIGGVVGHLIFGGTVVHTYNIGAVEPFGQTNDFGGITGTSGVAHEATVKSYFTDEIPDTGTGGIRKSETDLVLKSTYDDWDFEETWRIDDGFDFPELLDNPR